METKDPIGKETLERLSQVDAYSAWQYKAIKRYVGNRVMEIGSGIGNISSFLLDSEKLVLTDVNEEYLSILSKRFKSKKNVKVGPFNLDTGQPSYKKDKIDTIICMNVLEHIKDDLFALRQLHSMLEDDGKLLLLVPAHQFLFGTLDTALGHFRRYNHKNLPPKLIRSGFAIEKMFYFNRFATLGWWLNGRVLKKEILPEGQLSLFGQLVPVLSILDKILAFPFGISIIAVARKVTVNY